MPLLGVRLQGGHTRLEAFQGLRLEHCSHLRQDPHEAAPFLVHDLARLHARDELRVSGNVVPAIGPLRVAGRIADDHAEGVAAQGGS